MLQQTVVNSMVKLNFPQPLACAPTPEIAAAPGAHSMHCAMTVPPRFSRPPEIEGMPKTRVAVTGGGREARLPFLRGVPGIAQ